MVEAFIQVGGSSFTAEDCRAPDKVRSCGCWTFSSNQEDVEVLELSQPILTLKGFFYFNNRVYCGLVE